jgi:dTDP-4-amino-4,6-dideoxygalactose transaminase
MQVPFFRPEITEEEIAEVVSCLRSGWLTTGPLTRRFEREFAEHVGAKHAVAVNSCTAALHLAVEAMNLRPGQAVLVPTMTFAATAEIIRYQGALPLLVDCDPATLHIDLTDAQRKIEQLRRGELGEQFPADTEVVGIIPVHFAGVMLDVAEVNRFAQRHGLWVIEDAAHSFPAAWRAGEDQPWQRCGEGTAAVTCFSFYANKTITTGEGGMAVTDDEAVADRMRCMSLHGLSHDAWGRYSGGGWDYRIVAPGFKYNLTDIASALGIHQLQRAEELRGARSRLASVYGAELANCDALELPTEPEHRVHAWHLYPLRLRLDRLVVDRNAFVDGLKEAGVGCSVHWRPLHLHPYYEETFGWSPEQFPQASQEWLRRVTLPLFPAMRDQEQAYVIEVVQRLAAQWAVTVEDDVATPVLERVP